MFPEFILWSAWFQTVAILLFVLFLVSLSTKKQGAKNLPPSPPRLPIIGNMHQLGKLPHRSLTKLSQKYGPVMLLNFGNIPTVIVSSPETAKQVLKTHDIDCCSRPLSVGSNKLTCMLDIAFSPYCTYWKEIRKICMLELFSAKRVNFFQFVRDQEVGNLIQELSQAKSPVKINEKIFGVMNNIICKIAFGKTYKGKQLQSFEFEKGITEAMAMLNGFWFADFFPFFGTIIDKMSGMQKRLETCSCDLNAFFERVIDEHLDPERPKPEREDIIDILLAMSTDTSAPLHLTRDHIMAICFDMLVGATDTSALTMIWAMTELCRHPRVMRKVQAEIRSKVGRKAMVEAEEIENLKYLHMVVKETFRLHPPTALLIPRETMRPITIGGYDIAAKTRVLVNVWAIGRDPGIWENPEEFYPERFENSDISFKGQHYELLPFGGGRRICPGLAMGALSVEFTMANLLHCFDWKLADGKSIEDIDMEEEAGLTVHKKSPLLLLPITHKWE